MAKRKQPETSLDAYHSLDPVKISDIHQKILNALSVIGEGTFEDISRQLKVPKERVWKRLSELGRMSLIHRPGIKKQLKSGSQGYVWALTELGKLKVTERVLEGDTISDFSKKLIPKKINPPITTNTLF